MYCEWVVVFLFSHSYPTRVRLLQCFNVISLYLWFAWGKIPPPHIAYRTGYYWLVSVLQVSNLHLSNCKIEQKSSSSPATKKKPSRRKYKSSGVSTLDTQQRQAQERIWSVCVVLYPLSLTLTTWVTLELLWHPWDRGQNGINQKRLEPCIMGFLSNHFLLNSAEPEHDREQGAKWEGNC